VAWTYNDDRALVVRRAWVFASRNPALSTDGAATSQGVGMTVEVQVRDNNVDQALRALKKKMQREGLYREMRMRRHYEKPSERRAREKAEAIRRFRKLQKKRAERDEL
jgi:small subunit ribosomal protein S21